MDPASGVRRLKLSPQALVDRVTRTGDLFVIAQLGVPCIDPEQWFLTIDRLVARNRRLGLAQLRARRKVVEVLHQCSRNPLEPQGPTRRIANIWWGADLAALRDDLGVDGEAGSLWAAVSTTAGSQALLATNTPRTRLGSGAAKG